jgi:hypothetical protein
VCTAAEVKVPGRTCIFRERLKNTEHSLQAYPKYKSSEKSELLVCAVDIQFTLRHISCPFNIQSVRKIIHVRLDFLFDEIGL